MSNGKEIVVLESDNQIALPTTERRKQLTAVFASPNWQLQVPRAFPDVVTEREIGSQARILGKMAEAQREKKKWQRIEIAATFGGMGGVGGGAVFYNGLLIAGGFATVVGVSILGKSRDYERIVIEKWSEWQRMSSHWWEVER